MSNKITRKGIAFGVGAAFIASSLVAGIPAIAGTTDDEIELYPAIGDTLSSIKDAGVIVATEIDYDDWLSEDEGTLSWLITPKDGLDGLDYADMIEAGDLNFSLDYSSEDFYNDAFTDLVDWADGYDDSLWEEEVEDSDLDGVDLEYNVVGNSIVIKTQYEDGWNIDGDETYFLSVNAAPMSNEGADIKFDVRAWDDRNMDDVITISSDNDDDESRSSASRVVLYDSLNVSATSTITDGAVGEAGFLAGTIALSKTDINKWFVVDEDATQLGEVSSTFSRGTMNFTDSATYLAFDGEDFYIETYIEGGVGNEIETGNYRNRAILYSNYEDTFENQRFDNDFALDFDVNSAQWLGNPSSVYSLIAGISADVDGVYALVVDGPNVYQEVVDVAAPGVDTSNVIYRSNQKTGTLTAQVIDTDDDDLGYANVRVRATFSYDTLADEDSVFTVTGSTTKMTDANGNDIVVEGRTDSKGQVAFNWSNTDPDTGAEVDVLFEVLKKDGTWSSYDADEFSEVAVNWENGILDDFSVSPEGAVSGEDITLKYTVSDQFGEPLSIDPTAEDKALAVVTTVVEEYAAEGSSNYTKLEKTAKITGGSASIQFTNPAEEDQYVFVAGYLVYDDTVVKMKKQISDQDSLLSWELNQVYNNEATAEVTTVENNYDMKITYSHFLTGNLTEDDDLSEDWILYGTGRAADTDVIEVFGTVETADGAGAAYQAVTVSGAGLQFLSNSGDDNGDLLWGNWYNEAKDDVLSIGSATTYTDANGNFVVEVSAHMAKAGQTVTFTSGGKSTSVKLDTYMNTTIDEGDYYDTANKTWIDAGVIGTNWKKLTGNAPAANTSYVVKVTAKDVWGNTLQGVDIYTEDNSFDVEGDDQKLTNAAGVTYVYVKGDFTGNANLMNGYQNWKQQTDGGMEFWIGEYDYSDGNTSVSYDFLTSDFGSGAYSYQWDGIIGPQGKAWAGAKKGVVKFGAYNVKGKTVKVFVSGKLVLTTKADARIFKGTIKGVKDGYRKVTVKVGKTPMLTKSVLVK